MFVLVVFADDVVFLLVLVLVLLMVLVVVAVLSLLLLLVVVVVMAVVCFLMIVGLLCEGLVGFVRAQGLTGKAKLSSGFETTCGDF